MEEFSDRKRCREDNPEAAASPSPGQHTNKKRRKKKNKGNPLMPKEKGAEANNGSEVNPNHEPLDTVISIVPENKQGGNPVQPLACPNHEPPISIAVEKNGITVENPHLCSKLELAVESGKEKVVGVGHSEVTSQNPEKDTPFEMEMNNVFKPQGAEPNHAEHPQICSVVEPEPKKKKENGEEPNETDAKHPQVSDLAIPVGKVNNEGVEPPQVNAGNHPVCPQLESALPVNLEKKKEAEPSEPRAEHPQPQPSCKPDPTPPGDQTTPIQRRRKHRMSQRERYRIRRKGIMCSKGMVENQMNPLQCSLNQIQPHPGIPVDQENSEGAELPQVNAGYLTVCPKPESALPVNLEQKIEPAESSEPRAEHPQSQSCPKQGPAPPGGQTTPRKLSKGQRKRLRKRITCSEGKVDNQMNPLQCSLNQIQPCPKQGPAPPGDQTTPIKLSKGQRKRLRKRIMCSEGKVENQMNSLQFSLNQIQPHPAIPICPKPASPKYQAIPIDQTIPVDPAMSICPKPVETIIDQTIPVSPAIPIDTEQKTMKKERKSTIDGAESNEYSTEPPKTPIPTAICPIAAPPIGPAIPTGPEQKMTNKTRKRRKSALKSEGEELNKHNGKPHETPLQRSMCPIAATPIDSTIPMDLIIPIDPATPIDLEQKMPKKKKSALKSEVEEPNKHNGKPHETPVQRSMCPIAATAVDPTIPMDQIIPIDPATPIDPEQKMTKKRNSMLKSEGTSPGEHNAEPTVETPLHRIKGLTISKVPFKCPSETSMSEGKAKPSAKTPVQRTEGLKVTKVPFKQHGESSMNEGKAKPPAKTPVQRTEGLRVIKVPFKQHGESSMSEGKAKPPAKTTVQRTEGLKVTKVPFKQHGESSMNEGKAKPPAKTPVQRTEGLRVIKVPFKQHGESSMSEGKAKPPAKTPVQRTEGLKVTKVPFKQHGESSMSQGKAKPPAKTRVQITEGLKVTKVPFKQRGESSNICRACRQPGHKFEGCPMLKCLSKDDEVCFFCGEIGHSLGKCSVSKGGGRFAKCLFCYEQGHFSNNCPQNGHGIDPKAVAGIGPIIKTVETEEKSVAEVTTM